MATNRKCVQYLLLALLLASFLAAQETQTVHVKAPFAWPETAPEAARANELPSGRIASFLRTVTFALTTPASRIGGATLTLSEFRFAPLERGRFYLVAVSGGRVESFVDVVARDGRGYHYTRIESESPLPLGMSLVDLRGNGVEDLITAKWPAGYMGASTPPIYWYTVWRFRNGVPEDASAQFPAFYQNFALSQVMYLGGILGKLHAADPKGTEVPLAEIEYIHLKYERVILGQKDAGLEAAISWAQSGKVSLEILGMSSLAEIPSEAAREELVKLSQSPRTRDLAKAFLAKRARLLHQKQPDK